MATRAGLYANPLLEVEGDPFAVTANPYTGLNPAAQSGVGALQPGLVDQAIGFRERMMSSQYELPAGLISPPSQFGTPALTTPPTTQLMPAAQPPSGEMRIRLAYDPSTQRYMVNNQVFDARDFESLERVPEFIQQPITTEVPSGDWRPVDLDTLRERRDELMRISVGERVRLGTRQVAGAIPRGLGRLAEIAGAERTGDVLVRAGDRLSPDEYDQARQSAAWEANTLFQNMLGAIPEGGPSFAASIGSGMVGAAIGSTIAPGVGTVIGGLIGAASTVFPMMLDSAYTTASNQLGEEFVQSDQGRREVLANALGTTWVQIVAPTMVASRALNILAQRAGTQITQRAAPGVGRTAAVIGFTEGMAEMSAVIIEQVAFDPETRAMLSEGEVQALAPYVREQYGDQAAVAFVAGLVLGGVAGAGTAALQRAVTPEAETNLLVPTDTPPGTPPGAPQVEGAPIRGAVSGAPISAVDLGAPIRTDQEVNLMNRAAAVVEQEAVQAAQEPTQLELGLTEAETEAIAQAVAEPTVVPEVDFGVAPRQGELFTQAGRPTAAARVPTTIPEPGQLFGKADGNAFVSRESALGQRRAVSGRTGVPVAELEVTQTDEGFFLRQRGVEPAPEPAPVVTGVPEDAIQEPSPAAVPPREPARVSPAVGEPVPDITEPARAREPEIRPRPEEEVRQQAVREAEVARPSAPLPPLPPSRRAEGREQFWQDFAARQLGQETVAEPAPTPPVTPVVEATDSAQYRTVEEAWEALKPDGADEFNNLRPAIRDVLAEAYGENLLNQELIQQANELSPPALLRTKSNLQAGVPTLVVDDAGVARIETVLESERFGETFNDQVVDLLETLDLVRDIRQPTYDRKVYVNTIAELVDSVYLPNSITELKTETRANVQTALEAMPVSPLFVKGLHVFAKQLGGEPIDAQRIPFIVEKMAEEGLITDFAKKYGFINLPENLQPPVEQLAIDPTTGEQISTLEREAPAIALEQSIDTYNEGTLGDNAAALRNAERKLAQQYEQVLDDGLQDFVDARGNRLSTYFNEDGTPRIDVVDGRRQVVPYETELSEVNALASNPELFNDIEYDGSFSTLDGEPITNPLPIGRVRMRVNEFVKNLRVKPRTFVFRNQADLQASNPELFAQAVAARPQGDFATQLAAGYSFGGAANPTVIIFSDRIATVQQLNFVLAHETIGHIGMRSLLTQTRFKSVMEGIYNDTDIGSDLRFEVDAAMNADPNLSRAEAVEEYLADFAGVLDTDIVTRVFNAIKNILNRLGVRFSDDAARYLIGHAREYVRFGDVSSMFDAGKVATRIQELSSGLDPDGTGRFATSSTLGMDQMAAAFVDPPRWGTVSKALASGDHHTAAKEAMELLRSRGVTAKSNWEAVKRQLWRLTTYVKRENEGFDQVFGLFDQGTKDSYKIQNHFNEQLKLVFDQSMFDRVSGLPVVGGRTKAEINWLNKTLYGNLMKNRNEYTPGVLGLEPLYTIVDGEYIPNQREINRLFTEGTLSFEEMRDGYQYTLSDGSVISVEGITDLTENDPRYLMYMATMETLRDLQLQKVKATMEAADLVQDNIYEKLGVLMQAGTIAPQQRQFLENMHRLFVETYFSDPVFVAGEDGQSVEVPNQSSTEAADNFLKALNTALIAREAAPEAIAVERNQNVIEALRDTGREIDAATEADIIQNIEAFKALRVSAEVLEANDQKFTIQNSLKAAQSSSSEVNNAVKNAKRNIAVGYVPFVRRGTYEMAVEFFDRSGNKVYLTQEFKDAVLYRQFENEGNAVATTRKLNELFEGKFNRVLIKNSDAAIERGEDPIIEADVTPRAVARKTLDTVAAPDGLDLGTVTTFLTRFSIGLPPAKMTQIIVDLTTSDAAIRNKLQAQGTPGYDPDAVRALSEFIRKESSSIVKIRMRPSLNRALDLTNEQTRKLWQGDRAKLDRLRTTFETLRDDPTASKAAKQVAQREYRQYKYMYDKTNPPMVDGEQVRAEQWKGYYSEAQALVQFLYNNQNLNESDFGDSRYVALLRAATSIAMLGSSVATASLNFIALPTNFIPFMAAKDSDAGFGGGFNANEVTTQLLLAIKQVGTLKARTAKFYYDLAANETALAKAGLSIDEALFMARQIESGVAIPAQTNQLQQAALNRVTSPFWQKFWQGYMWTFNSSERSSRRAAVLTAYRMERDRRLESGYPPEQAQELARVFAQDAIDLTLGNYATYNRPKFFRDGPAGLLFIFNTFPHMSIQTLAHLPKVGQLRMLAALFVFTGITGFPFAENLEDIIDTIAQKLGLPMGSVRAEAAKLGDAIFPGASPVLLNGVLRGLLPAEIASRTSLGRPLPGTGIALPGASATREAAQMLGPAFSMLQGIFATTGTLARATYRPETTFNDALRISPVTAFRLVGDSWSYYNTGAITDRRGYIVSPDMSAGVIASRLLGYYPTAAADQYQTIMVARRINDYQREISANFRVGWVKAKMAGNEERARQIEEAVRDWNKTNRGTALEVRNFRRNATRALREARRPALERLLRASPVSARRELEQVDELLTSQRP